MRRAGWRTDDDWDYELCRHGKAPAIGFVLRGSGYKLYLLVHVVKPVEICGIIPSKEANANHFLNSIRPAYDRLSRILQIYNFGERVQKAFSVIMLTKPTTKINSAFVDVVLKL